MNWIKTGKRISSQGTDTIYEAKELPGVVIESRKRHIPHANGSGTWDHTSYFLIKNGVEKEFYRLRDAQAAAEQWE